MNIRKIAGLWILIVSLALLGAPAGLLAQAGEQGALEPAVEDGAEETVVEEAVAEKVRPTFGADMGFFSQYVWRGYGLSEKSCVIQPSLTAEYYGFSLNLWANLDTNVPGAGSNSPALNETDLTVAYDHSFGPVGVGVGYIYYGLDSVPDSQEAYISVGVDTILSPSFTAYREFTYYPGWYLNLGISQSFDLIPEHLSLDLAGSIGYLDADGAPGYFNDANVSLGFTIPIGEYIAIVPVVAYSFYLSGAAYDGLAAGSVDGKADHIYGGATFSIAF